MQGFGYKKPYLVKILEIIHSNFLLKFHKNLKKNFMNKNKLEKIKNDILKTGVKLEYFELRNKNNLSKKYNKNNFKIFLAYYIKNVRLIDNV